METNPKLIELMQSPKGKKFTKRYGIPINNVSINFIEPPSYENLMRRFGEKPSAYKFMCIGKTFSLIGDYPPAWVETNKKIFVKFQDVGKEELKKKLAENLKWEKIEVDLEYIVKGIPSLDQPFREIIKRHKNNTVHIDILKKTLAYK